MAAFYRGDGWYADGSSHAVDGFLVRVEDEHSFHVTFPGDEAAVVVLANEVSFRRMDLLR